MFSRYRLSFLVLCFAACVWPSSAVTRRAVLVGINIYNPSPAQQAPAPPGPVFRRPAITGSPMYWRFDNLNGAIADVNLMKEVLESLGFTDFVILTDQDATAAAILTALEQNLVDDAAPGDIRVFYYSGHGNHMRNLASKEEGGEDQTIVPADHWRGTPDIRDKEISRILWKAAKKGVRVTFIADSCHSGSLSRGAWNARGKARTNSGRGPEAEAGKITEPVANDPADMDAATGKPIDPEALGVLTLAAAQPTEEALETQTEDGDHGAFTWALARSLRSADEPMRQVFARAVTAMRASAVPQLPVMGGMGRADRGIFGDPATAVSGLTVMVQSYDGKTVHLRGGTAIGVYPHSTFKSVARPPLELEITSADASTSLATATGLGTLKTGDLFVVDKWVVPPAAALRVYIPNPAPAAALLATAREIGKLRADSSIVWLPDATAGNPTCVMSWTGTTWILEQNPATGHPADLGAAPSAEAIRKLLPAGAKFLLLLPPSTEFAAALPFGSGQYSAIETRGKGKQNTPAGAHYWFHGRLNGDNIEYAWVLPDSTEESVRDLAGQAANNRPSGYMPLPIRSDWAPFVNTPEGMRSAAASLCDYALRLARIRSWLALTTPDTSGAFPYHLAFKNVATGQFRETGDMRDGEKYKIYLRADPSALTDPARLSQRYVYVFAVDHFGKGSLLFPPLGRGNLGNRMPYTMIHEQPKFEPSITLTGGEDYDFSIGEPFGVDSYFLVSSDEPIDNPDVFEFEGARTRGGVEPNYANPLTALLADVGGAARAPKPRQVPAQWSIESVTIRSVPVK